MAHQEQMWFISNCRSFFPEYFVQKKVLEIGSLDINGSIRPFFSKCEFVGVDIGPGKGVDVVCKGEDLGGNAFEFDVVVSTEVFEHTSNWDIILLNMIRKVKREGLLIFSCAGFGRDQHGTKLFTPGAAPHVSGGDDYYRNLSVQDFEERISLKSWFSSYLFIEEVGSLYFIGLGREFLNGENRLRPMKYAYEAYLKLRLVDGLPHSYAVKALSDGPKRIGPT